MQPIESSIGPRQRRLTPGVVVFAVLAVCGSGYAAADRGASAGSYNWSARPTISGTPITTAAVGQPYSFTPTASAPHHYPVGFSVSGKPSWAIFSVSTGQLSGTPGSADVGTYSNIVISASDPAGSASMAPFSITVTAPTAVVGPPVISGTPASAVNAGSAYSFSPTVSAPTGAAVTFSISGQPSWATFNSSTGQLSGTPVAANVGVYANVVISAGDAGGSVSLAPFTITVNQVSNGSATVSWIPPTQNTDGTALSNLAGYNIYYGSSASNLNQAIQVTNPGLTSYMVSNLPSGTWYFAMTAYNTAGASSSITTVGSKLIP